MRCQLLRDSDATSMAHSLELRVPFVDIELARFARTCKDDFKLDSKPSKRDSAGAAGAKRVLLHALCDILPADVHTRPKRGFSLPIEHWMSKELQGIVEETCSSASVGRRGLLEKNGVAALMSAGAKNPSLLYPKIWSLVILELWCRSVLDTAPSLSDELESCHHAIVMLPNEQSRSNEHMDDAVSCGSIVTPR